MPTPSPRQEHPASWIAGLYLALGLLLTMLAAALTFLYPTGAASIPDDAILMRIRPLADVEFEPRSASLAGAQGSGKVLVKELCQSCHGKGIDGAPKIGDHQAWAMRTTRGLDALAQSVTDGKCGMPARVGSLPAKPELARAIVYMVWPSMRL